MKKKIVVCFTLIFVHLQVFGQSNGVTPLHLFFQKNADSTIIIEYPTASYDPHRYGLLTKTGDTIITFKYDAIQNNLKVLMPKRLGALISLEKYKYFGSAADINPYFTIVNLPVDTLRSFWKRKETMDIWKVVVDNRAPNCEKKYTVSTHPDKLIIYLITKKEIKLLEYESAFLYEKICPGNFSRKTAVGLYYLFETYLK